MKICIILGTRPEIIKMSPVIRTLASGKDDYFVLHTGQHYSYNLDKIFFEELNLPKPKYNLNVGSGTGSEQVGKMLPLIEKVLKKEKPDVVLVEGDTNSVFAGALTASRLEIPVGHVEAGLRSYDRTMPEEINRIMTDHIADYLFVPTPIQKGILLGEGIENKKIFITGNTVVDALVSNLKLSKKKTDIAKKMNLSAKKYLLVTLHRQENVDKKARLRGILIGLKEAHSELKVPILFPIHPRTVATLKRFGLELPKGVTAIPPVGYLDFLQLEANAKLILTDSGGVQEEACILKVPCVTLRDNTERPETVEVGANILAGVKPKKMLKAIRYFTEHNRSWKNPLGDGTAGKKIIKIITKRNKSKSNG